MADAVILDFDGVIADTEPLHFSAEKLLFEYRNIHFSRNMFDETLGMKKSDVISYYVDHYGLSGNLDELIMEHDFYFQKLLQDSVNPIPGIYELLEFLRNNKIPFTIGSSNTLENILLVLRKLDIYFYFTNSIVDSCKVEHGKPEPDIFLLAAKNLGVPSNSCLVIDDSLNGVIASARAGMSCIYYTSNPAVESASYKCKIVGNLHEIDLSLIQSI